MRLRLAHKLMIGFVSVVLLGGLSIVIVLNFSTRNRYFRFVAENDIAIAESVAQTLELYYRTEGSWDAVAAAIEGPRFGFGMSAARMGPGGVSRGRGMMMVQLPLYARIVLTDAVGNVLADSGEQQLSILDPKNAFAPGAPVRHDNIIIGLVYAGTMVEPQLHPIQRAFLRSLNRIVIISSVVGLGLAMLIGSLLQRQIIRPLSQLTGASRRIAQGHLSTRVDISSRDEMGDLADSFNAMADSMEGAVKWRKQIVADVAHELRTPLSLLQGRLEMMIDGVYPADISQLRRMYEETQRLNDLVGNIEELSRAEADQIFLSRSPVLISDVADGVILQYREQIKNQNIDLSVTSGSVPAVSIDPELIGRVFTNLIANSLHHMPNGGSIEISTAVDSPATTVRVCVKDTGPGIPDTELDRVFERFYRVDGARSRREGGSGLGLAICREIVRKHGGRIWAESPGSGGALICFTLPVSTEIPG